MQFPWGIGYGWNPPSCNGEPFYGSFRDDYDWCYPSVDPCCIPDPAMPTHRYETVTGISRILYWEGGMYDTFEKWGIQINKWTEGAGNW
jgi:hypothetical protein